MNFLKFKIDCIVGDFCNLNSKLHFADTMYNIYLHEYLWKEGGGDTCGIKHPMTLID